MGYANECMMCHVAHDGSQSACLYSNLDVFIKLSHRRVNCNVTKRYMYTSLHIIYVNWFIAMSSPPYLPAFEIFIAGLAWQCVAGVRASMRAGSGTPCGRRCPAGDEKDYSISQGTRACLWGARCPIFRHFCNSLDGWAVNFVVDVAACLLVCRLPLLHHQCRLAFSMAMHVPAAAHNAEAICQTKTWLGAPST